MQFDIVTIFPEMFRGVFESGIVRRAIDAGLVQIQAHDLREFTRDKHRQVDDRPFGGGAGMVMKPEPLFRAVEALHEEPPNPMVVLLTPQGRLLTQTLAQEFASKERIALICGRYEGIDERVVEKVIDEEVSIGDYVLSGGEIAAMVVIDAVTRLLPGALGSADSAANESFVGGILDFPQYTRPADYRGLRVPEVLLGGNHRKIERWRRRKALEKTLKMRPDLLSAGDLSDQERNELEEILKNIESENA
jgi:tRNA (guanine37-N1)-methyltransferase